MAMRQGSGGVSATLPRQSASPVYEDFQPRLEQKEEPAASVILVHLPGFVKERIKITYVQSSSILRVNGERPLKDNKWSRFNQAFPIPENSDVDKIQAKFQQGILTITMPKKIIAQVRPAEEPKTIQKATTTTESSAEPKPQEVAEEIPPPKPTSAQTIAQKAASPPWKSAAEPKPQKVLEEIPPPTAKTILQGVVEDNIPSKATSTAIDERQKEESSASKAQKVEDVTAPKAASTTDTLIKESGKFMERTMAKGKESVQKIQESALMAETAAAKILDKEKEKKQRNADDFNAEKETGLKNTMESAKQKVKNLGSKRLNEEERQSLINVGAAVLVVVALGVGVYISYRYNSSGKSEK